MIEEKFADILGEREIRSFVFTKEISHLLNFVVMPNFFLKEWFTIGMDTKNYDEDVLIDDYEHCTYLYNFYDYVSVNCDGFNYNKFGLDRNFKEYYNTLCFLNGYYSEDYSKYLVNQDSLKDFKKTYCNFLYEVAVANLKYVDFAYTRIMDFDEIITVKEIVPCLPNNLLDRGISIGKFDKFSGPPTLLSSIDLDLLKSLRGSNGVFVASQKVVDNYVNLILKDLYSFKHCEISNSFYEKYFIFSQIDYRLVARILLSNNNVNRVLSEEVNFLKRLLVKNMVYLSLSYYDIVGFIG